MFLSQPPTARTPSIDWPLTTVSIESAITSRETSEYFMPSVPIEMPSATVIVPKTWGMTPASRSAAIARSDSVAIPALQGVRLLWAFATPTIAFSKAASSKPTARSIERLGARMSPCVIALLRLSLMAPPEVANHTRARLVCARRWLGTRQGDRRPVVAAVRARALRRSAARRDPGRARRGRPPRARRCPGLVLVRRLALPALHGGGRAPDARAGAEPGAQHGPRLVRVRADDGLQDLL